MNTADFDAVYEKVKADGTCTLAKGQMSQWSYREVAAGSMSTTRRAIMGAEFCLVEQFGELSFMYGTEADFLAAAEKVLA